MAEELTPMMRQYRKAQEELDKDTLLFFRMGDFYEMFFDDAVRAAPILGVVVTKRGGVPMCGVPYHALDAYLAKVIKLGLKAAVCEQVEDPKLAKGLVRREITRVVTPGTILEDAILDATADNFLASVFATKDKRYGLALLELSTGEFIVETCENGTALEEALRSYRPSETVVSQEQRMSVAMTSVLHPPLGGTITEIEGWRFLEDQAHDTLCRHFKVHSLEGFCTEGDAPWVPAAGALIHYVREGLHRSVAHVRSLDVRTSHAGMVLDDSTCMHLDLLPSAGRPEKETLLGVLDVTRTPMGARLLKQWLRRPLAQAASINARLDGVADLIAQRGMLNALRTALGSVRDLPRLISRLDSAAGNARDLRALGDSLACVPQVVAVLRPAQAKILQFYCAKLHALPELTEVLLKALVDTPPIPLKEGGLIQAGYHADLDELRRLAQDGHAWLARYQAEQQEATGIKTLKVRHNNVFGFYIEVSKGQVNMVPESYERRQTLVNAERYITPELKEYEEKIVGAQDKSFALEYELFCELRERACSVLTEVQETAGALAALDVLQSFADRALALSYTRPVVDDSDVLEIREGRHPVVEQQLDSQGFVPNDTKVNTTNQQFLLITGPNMAGKSTYIRQVAVIAIMAHMGAYVPADSAHIGVIDRVFTRVGAGDDLARGRSTFMVEMQETANILNNATERSLIILDEIGRGTSTFDGISIAWSVVEFLHNTTGRKARTLFATHYHELTELSSRLDGVKNYTVQVQEQGESIVFLRRIIPGCADKSYGIHVARLAGMPAAVVDRAQEVLAALEGEKVIEVQTTSTEPKRTRRRSAAPQDSAQLDLFDFSAQGN